MNVRRIDSAKVLPEIREVWDQLAGDLPFRRYSWLTQWWNYYGGDDSLYVLVVTDGADRVIGIAPWYLHRGGALGRTIRFLGDGEVCSDHLTVLCQPGSERAVAQELAQWLTAANHGQHREHRWDQLCLAEVKPDDATTGQLVAELGSSGCAVSDWPGQNTWKIQLPSSWEDYLQQLSKSHRKQLRRLARELDSGLYRVRELDAASDFALAWGVLIELHQRRRNQLGQPGRFSGDRFALFLEDISREFFAQGRLRLFWIQLESQPIAVKIQFLGNGSVSAYQSGLHPDYLDHQPGRLANIVAIRQAIDGGCREFDLLRGDEPYKPHLGALPQATVTYRIASKHLGAGAKQRLESRQCRQGIHQERIAAERTSRRGVKKSVAGTALCVRSAGTRFGLTAPERACYFDFFTASERRA